MNLKKIVLFGLAFSTLSALAECEPTDPKITQKILEDVSLNLSFDTKNYLLRQDLRAHLAEVAACLAAGERIPRYHAMVAIQTKLNNYQEERDALLWDRVSILKLLNNPQNDEEAKKAYGRWFETNTIKIESLDQSYTEFISGITKLMD